MHVVAGPARCRAADAGLRASGLARAARQHRGADAGRRAGGTNLAGPRRGAGPVRARDHFLGFAAVNGRGEIWKAGGRVVKNVTGYDLCKAAGRRLRHALGADRAVDQGAAASPSRNAACCWFGLDDAAAIAALAVALNTPHEVSSAAHLPAAVAARSGVRDVARRGRQRDDPAARGSRTFGGLADGRAPGRTREPASRETMPASRFGRRSARCSRCWRKTTAWSGGCVRHPPRRLRCCARCVRAVRRRMRTTTGVAACSGSRSIPPEAGADCGALLVRGRGGPAPAAHAMLLRAPAAARARRWGCSSRAPGAPRCAGPARQERVRPRGRAQSGPHAGEHLTVQTSFTEAAARRSGYRVLGLNTARLPCIAGSARRPARPTCCSATSSTVPRGRIYLIKDMLENDRPATEKVVKHVDRCLSCLALHDHLSVRRELHAPCRPMRAGISSGPTTAPGRDRVVRRLLADGAAAHRACFRGGAAGAAAWRGRSCTACRRRCASMTDLAPRIRCRGRPAMDRPQVFKAEGVRTRRVGPCWVGCAQRVLAPQINEADDPAADPAWLRGRGEPRRRLLRRADASSWWRPRTRWRRPTSAPGPARSPEAAWMQSSSMRRAAARRSRITGSCSAMTRHSPTRRARSRRLRATSPRSSARSGWRPPAVARPGQRVAYHGACSLQAWPAGAGPARSGCWRRAGFEVVDVPEGHLCCGSAGTYNLLQPEIATQLRDRKVANIERQPGPS